MMKSFAISLTLLAMMSCTKRVQVNNNKQLERQRAEVETWAAGKERHGSSEKTIGLRYAMEFTLLDASVRVDSVYLNNAPCEYKYKIDAANDRLIMYVQPNESEVDLQDVVRLFYHYDNGTGKMDVTPFREGNTPLAE